MSRTKAKHPIKQTVLALITLIAFVLIIWSIHDIRFTFTAKEIRIHYEKMAQDAMVMLLYDSGEGFDEFNIQYVKAKAGSTSVKIQLAKEKIQRLKITFDEVQDQKLFIHSIQLASYFLQGEELLRHFQGEAGTTLTLKENNIIVQSKTAPSFNIINDFSPLITELENKMNFTRKTIIYVILLAFYVLFNLSSRFLSMPAISDLLAIPKWAMIFLFALLIWLPLIEMNLDLFPNRKTKEKRELAKKPKVRMTSLSQFPHQYESYFNDHFGLRSIFVHSNNYIKAKFLKTAPIPKLIIGKKGWIFYRSEKVNMGTTILDYRGLLPFSKEERSKIIQNIQTMQSRIEKRNMVFVFVIVPNKEAIYHNLLPSHIKPGKTRLSQIMDEKKSTAKINILDLREALFKQKKQTHQPLYYKGGTHWNHLGAFVGYKQIMNRLSNQFEDLKIFNLEDFIIKESKNSSHDHWLNFQDNRFYQFSLKKSTLTKKNSQKLIFFGDSFYEDIFEPFIKKSFTKAVFKHHNWENIDYDLIEKEKPDIVIYEIVERHLERILLH